MIEEWREMKPPYNNYKISNFGNFLNIKTNYLFSLNDRKIGYIRVALVSTNNKFKKFLAHRLVAEYFIGDIKNKCVHHIDGNTFNNKDNNLMIVTQGENNRMKINNNYGHKSRQIAQYDMCGNLIKIWNKLKDIPSRQSILKCLNGTYKTFNGYIWVYYTETIKDEIWEDICIEGYTLSVSSVGRLKTKSGKICFYTTINNNGYGILQYDKKCFSVHRLICMAFKPISNMYEMQVNHIDMNKLNNHIDNLEWVSPGENVKHYHQNTPKKEIICRRMSVKRIDAANNIKIYGSIMEAAQDNKISNGNIHSVCNGYRKSAGGYKWEYVK